ncbi:Uncharacterized protein Rs2_15275 [Raphanus sativus]|nr:Uncharacterized protein Rs2_15275 [Raphanus sativus]
MGLGQRRQRSRSHSLRYGQRVSAGSGTGGFSSALVSLFSLLLHRCPLHSPCLVVALLLVTRRFRLCCRGAPVSAWSARFDCAWRRFGCLICSVPVGSFRASLVRAVSERRVAANHRLYLGVLDWRDLRRYCLRNSGGGRLWPLRCGFAYSFWISFLFPVSGSCNQGELCRRFSLVVLLVFVLVWWVRATEPSFSQDKAFLSPVLGEGGGRGFYWLLLSEESLYPRWIFRLCDISRGRVSFSIMAVLHRISFCRFCSSVQVSIHGNRRQCSRAGAIFKGLCSFPSFYSICAFIEGDGYKGLRRSSETSYSKDDKDSPGILGNKENLTYPKSSSEVENGNRFSRKLKNG